MEALEKQNEELNTRLTAAEARSSQKERECEERHEKEMRDRVHQGKWPVDPEQQDNESTVQGDRCTLQNEEHHDKSPHVKSPNDGSR
jgi:hypothetical protein